MGRTLRALWRGDLPLGLAFWHYAIGYGAIASILATAAAIAAALAGLPDWLAIVLHFLPLPYLIVATVGVWRSAETYSGNAAWATAAKVAAIVWAIVMIIV